MKWILIFTILLISFVAQAIEDPGVQLKGVGLTTSLSTQVDLNLKFTSSTGQVVALKDLVSSEKPLIIIPAYYTCPRLCGLLLDGAAKLLNQLTLKPGQDFSLVTVSFNAQDTVQRAAKMQAKYIEKITNNPDITWDFLIGGNSEIHTLMHSLGFRYYPDKEEFAHTAAIFILTPNGKISQYFAGIDFDPFSVRLALVEAAQGKIGSLIDQVLLFCFSFDHIQGKYVWVVTGSLKILGFLTILLLGGFLIKLFRADRARMEKNS